MKKNYLFPILAVFVVGCSTKTPSQTVNNTTTLPAQKANCIEYYTVSS